MRVLLTGASGFAGHHCLEHLLVNTDWHVTCTDSFRHKGKSDRIREVLEPHPEWRERVDVIAHDLAAPFTAQTMERAGDVDYVIAMASQSHVDRSIDDPVPFVQNNVNVILSTLEFCRQARPSKVIVVSTDEVYGPMTGATPHSEWAPVVPSNPYAASKASQEAIAISYWRSYGVPVVLTNCFDMTMRVFTADGLKRYDQLAVGDMVWALDASENMVLEPVLGLLRRPADRMVRISGKGVSQLVTPEHRMMIRRSVGKPRRWQAIEEIAATDLVGRRGRVRIPRYGNWTGNGSPVFRPRDHARPPSLRSSAARGRGWAVKHLPAEMPTEQVAALFGWYISEGCVSGTTVRLAGASPAQQQALRDCLDGIDGEPYVNGNAVCIANGHLAALLALAGAGARNKVIPPFIRDLDVKYLQVFFDAMIAGDGTRYGAGAVYYTTSTVLAEQMCEIGMKLGYAARISMRQTWNPRRTASSESYIVRLTPCAAEIEARNVTEEDYDGDVWCLSVPSGRVFVERDGIISLSGQCMNLVGERQDPEKFVPKVIKSVLDGAVVPVHGTPGNIGTRYYLHARNAADAWLYLLLNARPAMFCDGAPQPSRFNVVGDERVSNLDLAQMIAGFTGRDLRYELVDFHSARPGHDPHYGLDGNRLWFHGWKAPLGFAESLRKTVEWTVANPRWLL